jgi:hypothetical protein
MTGAEKTVEAQGPQASDSTPAAVPGNDTTTRHKPGESWKASEEHVLPHNRLGIVFFGLMSCTFLAALDQVRYYRAFHANASMLRHRRPS